MSKRLLLVRHAKSSWSDPTLSDKDRPLNKRGLRDGPRMGGRIRERLGEERPVIVASTAHRARATAHLLAGELGIEEGVVSEHDELYLASPEAMMQQVKKLDDEASCVVLVGHNPGISEFAMALTGAPLQQLPTCGLVALSLPIERWVDAKLGTGTIDWLDCPKRPGLL